MITHMKKELMHPESKEKSSCELLFHKVLWDANDGRLPVNSVTPPLSTLPSPYPSKYCFFTLYPQKTAF